MSWVLIGICVGDCLQDLTTNTLTRNLDFFYFIDHRKTSLPARDYKSPFQFLLVLSCLFYHCQSLVWVSIKRFQSSRLSDSHIVCHATALNIFSNHIVYNQNKAMIALTITKTTNNNNAPHNFLTHKYWLK